MKRYFYMCLVAGLAALPIRAAESGSSALSQWMSTSKSNADTNRESVITSDRIEFDNKEGVILFDSNVHVDDARFDLRSDRLLLFLDGTDTNKTQDVQQILAIGHVVITNETRSASCNRAVYTRKDGQIVMTGDAKLDGGPDSGVVTGRRIVFWLDDERLEVTEGSRVTIPAGMFNKQRDKQKSEKPESASASGKK